MALFFKIFNNLCLRIDWTLLMVLSPLYSFFNAESRLSSLLAGKTKWALCFHIAVKVFGVVNVIRLIYITFFNKPNPDPTWASDLTVEL